jgi:hypothetical protein
MITAVDINVIASMTKESKKVKGGVDTSLEAVTL